MNLNTVKWAQWDKTQSRELLVCSYVCALHCAQLLHTILHKTDLIVFPLTLQTITTIIVPWSTTGSHPSLIHHWTSSFLDPPLDLILTWSTTKPHPWSNHGPRPSLIHHWTSSFLDPPMDLVLPWSTTGPHPSLIHHWISSSLGSPMDLVLPWSILDSKRRGHRAFHASCSTPAASRHRELFRPVVHVSSWPWWWATAPSASSVSRMRTTLCLHRQIQRTACNTCHCRMETIMHRTACNTCHCRMETIIHSTACNTRHCCMETIMHCTACNTRHCCMETTSHNQQPLRHNSFWWTWRLAEMWCRNNSQNFIMCNNQTAVSKYFNQNMIKINYWSTNNC